jgi:hypothetical protein
MNAVVATFLPLARMAQTSSTRAVRGVYSTQSASRARIASTSVVAATPIGSRPTRVPMSTPFLSAEYTRAPTTCISRRRSRIVMSISVPTAPVPH